MRVIVTRPQGEAQQWVNALTSAGYQAQSLPLIDVLPAAQAQPCLLYTSPSPRD